jgi:hypothetical protein
MMVAMVMVDGSWQIILIATISHDISELQTFLSYQHSSIAPETDKSVVS